MKIDIENYPEKYIIILYKVNLFSVLHSRKIWLWGNKCRGNVGNWGNVCVKNEKKQTKWNHSKKSVNGWNKNYNKWIKIMHWGIKWGTYTF